jgi:regulator of protease activity HflC (stomatin/prohibitin superfamily)
MDTIFAIITMIVLLLLISTFHNNIPEGKIGIVTRFGRFTRTIYPGFNVVYPWDSVNKLSIQNKAIEMPFQAITLDQASVHFNCTILLSLAGTDDEMVKRAFYSFTSNYAFEISVQRLLEDETRAYVATMRQAEMIGISQDVVVKIKQNVDAKIAQWGYQIDEIRYNNLHFDKVITASIDRVVAAVNELEAAENEGEALRIRKIKEAEADGEFIRIQAEAERTAWKLRGQGLSEFRQEVSKGTHIAVEDITKTTGLDPDYLLFFMYTESLKYIADNSSAGSTIFVDNNPSAPNDIMQQMSAFNKSKPVSQKNQIETDHLNTGKNK